MGIHSLSVGAKPQAIKTALQPKSDASRAGGNFNSAAPRSTANPNGSVVRCAPDGSAAYSDIDHQVAVGLHGTVTVLHRDRGAEDVGDLRLSCQIRDGKVTYQGLSSEDLPEDGALLQLRGDTKLYTKKSAGEIGWDIAVINVPDPYAHPKASAFLVQFRNVGSGVPFEEGKNLRQDHGLGAIAAFERDFPNTRAWSETSGPEDDGAPDDVDVQLFDGKPDEPCIQVGHGVVGKSETVEFLRPRCDLKAIQQQSNVNVIPFSFDKFELRRQAAAVLPNGSWIDDEEDESEDRKNGEGSKTKA